MTRFVSLEKHSIGRCAPEGEIVVSIDQIIAIEASPGTGGGYATVTLSGGREVNVRGPYEVLRDAIMHPVQA